MIISMIIIIIISTAIAIGITTTVTITVNATPEQQDLTQKEDSLLSGSSLPV